MPSSLTAGTTVSYTRTHSDYPASDGWALTLYVAGVSLLAPIVATVSGGSFVVTLSANATAVLQRGVYQWEERVSKAGDVYVAASGTVEVLPNIVNAGAGDLQTWEESTLAIIEAALTGRLPEGMESYSIAGRAVTKIPLSELVELRTKFRAAVAAQRTPDRFSTPVLITFSGTGFEK